MWKGWPQPGSLLQPKQDLWKMWSELTTRKKTLQRKWLVQEMRIGNHKNRTGNWIWIFFSFFFTTYLEIELGIWLILNLEFKWFWTWRNRKNRKHETKERGHIIMLSRNSWEYMLWLRREKNTTTKYVSQINNDEKQENRSKIGKGIAAQWF